jgi:CheY-like chemotaxis protein
MNRSDLATADASAHPPDAPIAVAPRRVLVVDDHPDAATSLAVILTAAGHDALPVRSAFTAIEALMAFDPDVCLVNLRMPRMAGFEAAARLWVILGPHVRLLAITGEPEAAADARAAAFERVFAKPIDVAELLRALAAVPATRPPVGV